MYRYSTIRKFNYYVIAKWPKFSPPSPLVRTCLIQKNGSIQYNAAIAKTGAIRGTPSEKLYRELSFVSLRSRRWLRELCSFYKIYKNQSPYLYNLIPDRESFILLDAVKSIIYPISKPGVTFSEILFFLLQ